MQKQYLLDLLDLLINLKAINKVPVKYRRDLDRNINIVKKEIEDYGEKPPKNKKEFNTIEKIKEIFTWAVGLYNMFFSSS